ncbi:MAG TPA: GxxExxY protein [Ignavibacteria bacterium]|jgi:GxxExxY protein|nr:GxxExxY protein [Ignavibacteria bacterium]
MNENYKYSDITEKIIGEAYKVHNVLGSGFLEKVYENALFKKLRESGLYVVQQYPIKVVFENEIIGEYCSDLFVESKVIVELKAVESLHQLHEVQLVNYLKATGIEVGLLLNFGKVLQVKRRVHSVDHNTHNLSVSKRS